MKKHLLLAGILIINIVSFSQVQQAWVARANGIENKDEFGGIIGRDAAGYLYIAGARHGSADEEDDGFLTIKYNPLPGSVFVLIFAGQLNPH